MFSLPLTNRRSALPIFVLAVIFFNIYLFHTSEYPNNSLLGFATSRRGGIQHSFSASTGKAQEDRLRAVKAEFLDAWDAYKEFAWMKDELRPVSGDTNDKYCGWAATLVDSLDTLWIMGLKEEFDAAVEATTGIDFTKSESNPGCVVNLFETTIRHLGGLMAAYDLSEDERLLPKTAELGNMLYGAFDTYNGIPCPHFSVIKPEAPERYKPFTTAALAALGSLNLEFSHLSVITGDPKYAISVDHVSQEFARVQMNMSIAGMWPENVDSSGEDVAFRRIISAGYSLGALSDSTYEYLVKGHLMMGHWTEIYADMWAKASRAIRELLLYRPMTPTNEDILFSGFAEFTGKNWDFKMTADVQHLACFQGGMFGLAGKIFNNPADVKLGQKLTDGCVWAYSTTLTGIMPERFLTVKCEDVSHCPWSQEKYDAALAVPWMCGKQICNEFDYPPGLADIWDPRYLLRPEAIESVFIMYRLTGDDSWREKGWRMFEAIRKHTRAPHGHSAIDNVMSEKPELSNEMESFWLAETLKYFYLLFSDTDVVSLDEYVLNTEAHPLKLSPQLRGF